MPAGKLDIAPALVSRLVSEQFPRWAELPVMPVEFDGWDNRTYRLGEAMSVRLPSAEAYALQVRKEQYWLPRLAPLLPVDIPVPVAMGAPSADYPWHWSVYRWLEGEMASIAPIADLCELAATLAQFLRALQQIDPAGGPPPGQHNFHRGAPPAIYEAETRQALAVLGSEIDGKAVTAVWEAALETNWQGPPVWLHGDVAATNLLVKDGRLNAVIDFGCSGVGDPACDLTIAWTFFSGESREVFREAIALDEATWARARGWALWKALITLAGRAAKDPARAAARKVIDQVLADEDVSV